MGFDTAAGAIASGMISNAVDLLSDFAPIVTAIFGIAALGLLFVVVRRFID